MKIISGLSTVNHNTKMEVAEVMDNSRVAITTMVQLVKNKKKWFGSRAPDFGLSGNRINTDFHLLFCYFSGTFEDR